MPDDVERWVPEPEPGTPERVADALDDLATFCHGFPGWVANGLPLSWGHYVHGMRFLSRAQARAAVAAADAGRMAQASADDYKEYQGVMRRLGG